jgi:hypothetical protein
MSNTLCAESNYTTAISSEVRLLKVQDHGLHIDFGGRQSCDTMKCDMSHSIAWLTSPNCYVQTMVLNLY